MNEPPHTDPPEAVGTGGGITADGLVVPEPGDVVFLRSGGPALTVAKVKHRRRGTYITVVFGQEYGRGLASAKVPLHTVTPADAFRQAMQGMDGPQQQPAVGQHI